METKKLHKLSTKPNFITAAVKPSKAKKPKTPKLKSAIFDIHEEGAVIWQAKFAEFIRATTYDSALGYPLKSLDTQDDRLNNGTVFDGETNPIVFDSYEDLHGDENDTTGLGGIGGGGEFSTGEVLVG